MNVVNFRINKDLLENRIKMELACSIGKVGSAEVDFIAAKPDGKLYFQVAESMSNETGCQRELAPLKKSMIIMKNCSLIRCWTGFLL